MTLEDLIEQARAKLTPEERAARQEERDRRMLEVDKRERKLNRDSQVTEELLNRVISL
jgi:hypothetical protein